MNAASKNDDLRQAESYLSWWQDAGVDEFVAAEPRNWLERPAKPDPLVAEKVAVSAHSRPQSASKPSHSSAATSMDKSNWPKDLLMLVKMIRERKPLPGNQYGGNSVVLKPVETPKVMFIGDLPDTDDTQNGNFLDGANGQLVQRMAAALGFSADAHLFTALASTRPATGALREDDFPILAEYMQHQIGLLKPERVVIFGSAACQALLGADMMNMRGNLHYFNHNVHKVAAVTTFHPRTLLTRPQMKGQAWKDLQVLIK